MDNLFFLEVKCAKCKDIFYARFDFAADDIWVLTYGLKNLPAGEKISSGTSQADISNMRTGPQYKCPYCGNKAFVRCGACSKLTCYDSNGRFVCMHCGNSGEVKGTIEKIDITKKGQGQ